MKRTLLIAAVVIGLTGCAGGGSSEYDMLVQQAESEISSAKKMNALWKDTEKFLANSKEASANGDMGKAMKLAKKALNQAQLAQQQAKDNANVKPYY